jgi:two-component system cell cycle response regulator
LRPGAVLEIGRASSAGISLPYVLSVSWSHARLRYGAQGVFIEDLGSTSGTLVGDVPVREPRSLSSGERFQVRALHFKFLNEQDVEQAYHSAVYELMIRDGLTGALNKTRFEEHAASECARAKRYSRPLSLVLFDIDEFKAVNDREGHLLGDQVLSRVAARVGAALRSEQAFGRVGGEEFEILCPETTEPQAAIVAERLRLLVEDLDASEWRGPSCPRHLLVRCGGDRRRFVSTTVRGC